MEELDVYLNTSLSPHLHMLLFPSAEHAAKLVGDDASHLECKIKHQNGIIELDIPLDTQSECFDREHAEALARNALPEELPLFASSSSKKSDIYASRAGNASLMIDKLRLKGQMRPCKATGMYCAGTRYGDAIYLTPISSISQLQPDLGHLDAADAKAKASAQAAKKNAIPSNNSSVNDGEDKIKIVGPQIKKRETEEQAAARLRSYAYLKRQLDDEPWVKLGVHGIGTQASNDMANKLVLAESKQLPVESDPMTYLKAMVTPPRPEKPTLLPPLLNTEPAPRPSSQ